MFLRRDKKPTTGAISRPTNTQTAQQNQNTVKALAGFDDEVEIEVNNNISNGNKNVATTNIFEEEEHHVDQKKQEPEAPSSTLYSYSELSQMDNLEYEVRLVQQILQPGGIKVKPNESLLNEFSQAAKTLDKNIIGSLLISRLEDGFPYQVKAKSLYTIQYLSKKNDLYKEYFNLFVDEIRAQPQPEDNINAYRNLINEVLSAIQNEVIVPYTSSNQVDIFQFNGPNYNNDLPGTKKQISNLLNKNNVQKTEVKKQEKIVTKKFISPSEAKKIQKSSVASQLSLIDTTHPSNNTTKPQAPKVEFNIFQLDLSAPQQQPKQPVSIPIQIPQIPSNYPTHFQNNFQQQQYQQQYQQHLYQQQQQQQQKQPIVQNTKQITGDDLYSMYKKL